jgi:hypothetical protein
MNLPLVGIAVRCPGMFDLPASAFAEASTFAKATVDRTADKGCRKHVGKAVLEVSIPATQCSVHVSDDDFQAAANPMMLKMPSRK